MDGIDSWKINVTNLYKIIDGKKYQFMGLYPNKQELQLDLERIHRKHGFDLKFEKDNEKMEVWRRNKKGESNGKNEL